MRMRNPETQEAPNSPTPQRYHAWYSAEQAEKCGVVYWRHAETGKTITCTEVSERRDLKTWWADMTWVGLVDKFIGQDEQHKQWSRKFRHL